MKALRKLGFDIGYLALLTKREVKPLSRWESEFSRGQIKTLHHLGLKTNTVERKLANGGRLTELIFSKSSRYLDFYTRRFDKTPVSKDRQTVMTEGVLFGYPGCCVRNFAENGYTQNDLVGHGQEILFHWACPGCRATPSLLPYYRKTHRECQQLFATQRPTVPELLKKSLPAATLSLLFALAPGKARADDPHWYSPSAVDTTHDFLEESEEFILGTFWGTFPEEVPNGPRESLKFSAIISSLPTTPSDTCCYLSEVLIRGIENCLICGQEMTMGGWRIHNPMRDTSIYVPNMALHYMEHGSFSFDGTENSGRVDIQLIKEVLAHYDTSHYSIETSDDNDDDGLRDDYEGHFGTQTNNPDSDNNHLVDGSQVAEQVVEAIAQLPIAAPSETPPDDSPYMVIIPANGLENCDICGITIGMGSVCIINPMNHTEIGFPISALHYLAHGRFAYSAGLTYGEIDAVQLSNVLDMLTSAPFGQPHPRKHGLSLANFPNPFNVSTHISFSLPKEGHVSLKIYNINGQLVRILLDQNFPAGRYQASWDGRDVTGVQVASGVYFYRLDSGGKTVARKMLLLK